MSPKFKTLNEIKTEARLAKKLWSSGCSLLEIAVVYDVTVNNMKQKIFRWRQRLPSWFPKRAVKKKPIKKKKSLQEQAELAQSLWISIAPDYSIEEIAEIYGVSVKAMRKKISYWRKKIPGWFLEKDRLVVRKKRKADRDIQIHKELFEWALPLYDLWKEGLSLKDIAVLIDMNYSSFLSRVNRCRRYFGLFI